MQSPTDTYTRELLQRQDNRQLRQLNSFMPLSATEVVLNNKKLINFSSNDYLGLSQHPFLKQRAIEFINQYGVGSASSRLVCGNIEAFDQVESKLASLKGTQSALIFSTGYQLNSTVFRALGNRNSLILCDRLSHNSLLHGITSSAAQWKRFKHNDIENLHQHLSKADQHLQKWIVTESVFSMDGDQSNLDELVSISENYQAQLFIDEAHATGVLGKNGMGLSVGKPNISLVMGTFSKACGSFGAYIACSKLMREYLVNFCSGIIYSTALPPPVLGAIDAALDLIPTLTAERQKLQNSSQYVRQALTEMNLDYGLSSTQIIPIIVNTNERAVNLSAFLQECGILAPSIRPPTVSQGSARVRLSLSAAHSDSQIEHLLDSVRRWRNEKY